MEEYSSAQPSVTTDKLETKGNVQMRYETVLNPPPADAELAKALATHMVAIARNPDKDSEFDMKTRDIRPLPAEEFLSILEKRGYDAFMAIEDASIRMCGVIGYQKHADGWHVFSVFVQPDLRGKKVAEKMLRRFLYRAHATPGVPGVRLSAGNSPVILHVLSKIASDDFGLSFTVKEGAEPGWLLFPDKESKVA